MDAACAGALSSAEEEVAAAEETGLDAWPPANGSRLI